MENTKIYISKIDENNYCALFEKFKQEDLYYSNPTLGNNEMFVYNKNSQIYLELFASLLMKYNCIIKYEVSGRLEWKLFLNTTDDFYSCVNDINSKSLVINNKVLQIVFDDDEFTKRDIIYYENYRS